jgi:hypothetical protein
MPAPGWASHGPYVFCEQQDTVDVIWRDDESLQENVIEMIRNVRPTPCHNFEPTQTKRFPSRRNSIFLKWCSSGLLGST